MTMRIARIRSLIGGPVGLLMAFAVVMWATLPAAAVSLVTERVTVSSAGGQGNGDSFPEFQEISPDGRFVAFDSSATNLVSGDTNGFNDVFAHDRSTGQTTRVSVSTGGEQGDDDSFA